MNIVGKTLSMSAISALALAPMASSAFAEETLTGGVFGNVTAIHVDGAYGQTAVALVLGDAEWNGAMQLDRDGNITIYQTQLGIITSNTLACGAANDMVDVSATLNAGGGYTISCA